MSPSEHDLGKSILELFQSVSGVKTIDLPAELGTSKTSVDRFRNNHPTLKRTTRLAILASIGKYVATKKIVNPRLTRLVEDYEHQVFSIREVVVEPGIQTVIHELAECLGPRVLDWESVSQEVHRPDFPDELRVALEMLARKCKAMPVQCQRAFQKTSYTLSIVTYTGLSRKLLDPQVQIRRVVHGLGVGFPIDLELADFGSAIQDSGNAIHVFPLFLTPSRTEDFGVVRIGTQTSLGIAVPIKHASDMEFKSLPHIPSSRSGIWLRDLFTHMRRGDGKVVWIHGYVQGELASILVENDEAAHSVLYGRRELISSREVEGLCFFQKDHRPDISDASVFLFDPGERSTYPTLDARFCEVYLDHGIDIPVGVGLSLPLIPRLVESGKWRILRKAALDAYLPYAEQLQKTGIDLRRGERVVGTLGLET